MEEKEITDPELRKMDVAQLEAFINAKPDSVQKLEGEKTVSALEIGETETPPETGQTAPNEKKEEKKDGDDEIADPYFRGKSRKDLYEIIKRNNAMISRQSNKEHEIMKRLEQLEQLKLKIESNKQEDDLYYIDDSGKKIFYDKRDLEVIDRIVDRKLEYRTKARQEREKQRQEKQRAAAIQENEQLWADLSAYNPALKAEIQEAAVAEIQRNRSATLETKGWLRAFIAANASPPKQKQSAPVLDKAKKLKAMTITSGSISKPVVTKSVTQMDADEYLKYIEESQGIKIPRA